MNKKGFEIGVNFLVVMILSIAILGMGFYMFNTLFDKTTNLQDSMTESSKREIDALLDTGEPVSIPRNARTIKAGDSEIFGVGIRNEGVDANFRVFVSGLTTKHDTSEKQLTTGARTHIPIMIIVPANTPRGSEVVNVEVCKDRGEGETCSGDGSMKRHYFKQKIFVTVP